MGFENRKSKFENRKTARAREIGKSKGENSGRRRIQTAEKPGHWTPDLCVTSLGCPSFVFNDLRVKLLCMVCRVIWSSERGEVALIRHAWALSDPKAHRQDNRLAAPFAPAGVQGTFGRRGDLGASRGTRKTSASPKMPRAGRKAEYSRGRAQLQRSAPATASCADADHSFHATILVHGSRSARASVCGLLERGARRTLSRSRADQALSEGRGPTPFQNIYLGAWSVAVVPF